MQTTGSEITKSNFKKHVLFRGQIAYEINQLAKSQDRAFANMAEVLIRQAIETAHEKMKDSVGANHE